MWLRVICVLVSVVLHTTTSVQADARPVITTPPHNVTGLVGESVDLPCEVKGGPRVSVRWFYQDRQLSQRGSNYKILPHSRTLRFKELELDDSGFYACEARNSEGTVRSPSVYLKVEAPVAIGDGPEDRVVVWGTVILMQCQAYGFPRPYIQWYKNGEPFVDVKTNKTYNKPELRVNVTQSATYTCVAENRMTSGLRRENRTGRITVYGRDSTLALSTIFGVETLTVADKMTVKDARQCCKELNLFFICCICCVAGFDRPLRVVTVHTDNRIKGICAPYNGTVCQNYIGQKNVYLNSTFLKPLQHMNHVIGQLFDAVTSDLSPRCRRAAERLFCNHAFPSCDPSHQPARPIPVCRENCIAVQDLFCMSEWNSVLNASREQQQFLVCDNLPSSGDSSKTCNNVDLFQITSQVTTRKCYSDRGQFYIGEVGVTEKGLECQAWNAQYPHTHSRLPQIYPVLQNASSYCRNAGGEKEGPWCYTMDRNIEWQYCDIPQCDMSPSTEDLPNKSVFDTQTIIIMTVVSVISLALLVLIAGLCYRMCDNRQHIKYTTTPQYDFDIDISKLPTNACYHQKPQTLPLHPKLESLEYPRNDIVYMCDIGQGAFGRVFKAKAPDLVKGQDWTVIAVKMLKDDATEDMQRDFEREASLMVEFDHPNIVKLLGVCAIGRPFCLLFEYMSHGDLNEFLRNCSPEHFIVRRRSTEVLTGDEPKLDHIEQLHVAKQIAKGMVYLSEKGYVHRDLATRNCLVGEDLQVKISDFGLTRCLHNGEYFQGSEHDAIPICWMPLEAILYNKFTSESDVWSFGVVLWEIFSFALQPYYGMVHEEVVKYVRGGKVLLCPDNTPQNIYDLMRLCWSRRPSNRPHFRFLLNEITNLQEEFSKRKKRPEKA